MASTHRALPVLLRICAVIDQLFIVEVGPFGQQLAEDARTEWLATGNRLRPASSSMSPCSRSTSKTPNGVTHSCAMPGNASDCSVLLSKGDRHALQPLDYHSVHHRVRGRAAAGRRFVLPRAGQR